MRPAEFQKVLFRSAVYTMAVDGEIHDEEIEEIKFVAKDSPYFIDFDFEKELETDIADLKANGKDAINNFLLFLESAGLTEKQEVILIETILRMIDADKKVETNEILFLQLVKAKVKISEEILLTKFPRHVEYLIDFNNYASQQDFKKDIVL